MKSKDELMDIFIKAISSNNFYNSLHKLPIGDLDAST